jgi:hypothetical protein
MAKNKILHILFFTIVFSPLLSAQDNSDSLGFLKDSLSSIDKDRIKKTTPAMVSPSILDIKPELPKFNYNIKDRAIPFTAQEVEIKALAYQEDSRWNYGKGFVRAMYGNAKNARVQTGIHHQQKESYDVAFLGQYSSLNQAELSKNLNYRYIDGRIKSHIITGENVVLAAGMNGSLNRFTLWHPTSAIETGRIRNIFNHQLSINFSNIEVIRNGWNWKAGMSSRIVNISENSGFEAGICLSGSVQKTISKNINFDLEAGSDNIYTYADSNSVLDIFHIKPVFSFSNKKINIKAGLHMLAATSEGINIFPAADISYTLTNNGISLFAGTRQQQHHNSLANVSSINPYLLSNSFLNTASWSNHIFTGVRIFSSAVALESKVGMANSHNKLLFIQTPQLSEEFTVRYDNMSSLYFGTSVQYFPVEFLSVNGSVDLVQYNPETEANAFNMPEANIRLGCDLKLFQQKLIISPDIQFLKIIRQESISPFGDNTLFGLHMQVAYTISKHWHIEIQGNNLLDSNFDRWNGYRYFGRNFALGVQWLY